MPEANDLEARLKIVETTVASFPTAAEFRQFFHDTYETTSQTNVAVTDMKAAKEKGVDLPARWMAIGALVLSVATSAGVAFYIHRGGGISQRQEVNVHEREVKTTDEAAAEAGREFANQSGIEP